MSNRGGRIRNNAYRAGGATTFRRREL